MSVEPESDTSPTVVSLQAQIEILKELATRVSELRRAPTFLGRSSSATSGFDTGNTDDLALSLTGVLGPPAPAKLIANQFVRIKEAAANALAEPTQAALKAAHESEKVDPKGVVVDEWRHERPDLKRKCVVSFLHPSRALISP